MQQVYLHKEAVGVEVQYHALLLLLLLLLLLAMTSVHRSIRASAARTKGTDGPRSRYC